MEEMVGQLRNGCRKEVLGVCTHEGPPVLGLSGNVSVRAQL